MNIEKLKSGSYRIREMYKGKHYKIVVDHKPTATEARAIIDEMIENDYVPDNISFYKAAKKYVAAKENVLSASTIREYTLKIDRFSKEFYNLDIHKIKKIHVQEELNRLSEKCSAKTVKDMYGFITAVMNLFIDDFRGYKVTLPTIVHKDPYIPSDEDIKAVIKASAGTQYEIPIKLGAFGLRRSEICAITAADIEGNIIHINKAKVQDKNKKWIIKDYTKTPKSRRDIVIPDDLANMIKEQGYAFNGFPGTISNYLRRTQDKLNLPHFSLHKERHYFASALSSMNVPEADILKMGGWSTPDVMKKVYRHEQISQDKKRQEELKNKLASKIFES